MDFLKKNKTIIIVILGIIIALLGCWIAIQLFSYYIWLQEQSALPLVKAILA